MRDRMLDLFDIIVAEFERDPMSVQCFDLRIVEEAIKLNREYKAIKAEHPWAL